MTVNHFYQLDEMEQAEVVWDGKHIGNRFDEVHNVLLYRLDGIYFVAYANTDELMPFLGQYENL